MKGTNLWRPPGIPDVKVGGCESQLWALTDICKFQLCSLVLNCFIFSPTLYPFSLPTYMSCGLQTLKWKATALQRLLWKQQFYRLLNWFPQWVSSDTYNKAVLLLWLKLYWYTWCPHSLEASNYKRISLEVLLCSNGEHCFWRQEHQYLNLFCSIH